ncbi:hypothetical protein [Timonella senegalensis]|uniref:hypothetical protein n=1 Tax=Timonella senegalensis TaxID=1465825 RepID=UPI0028AAA979|nr:hypothetical protein [Timonella senegalensis]
MHPFLTLMATIGIIWTLIILTGTIALIIDYYRQKKHPRLPCGHENYGWQGDHLIHKGTPIISCTYCGRTYLLHLEN